MITSKARINFFTLFLHYSKNFWSSVAFPKLFSPLCNSKRPKDRSFEARKDQEFSSLAQKFRAFEFWFIEIFFYPGKSCKIVCVIQWYILLPAILIIFLKKKTEKNLLWTAPFLILQLPLWPFFVQKFQLHFKKIILRFSQKPD